MTLKELDMMTYESFLSFAFRNRLTLAKLRVHLVRFRYRGVVSTPDLVPSERPGTGPRDSRPNDGSDGDVVREAAIVSSGPTRALPLSLAADRMIPAGTTLDPGGVYIDLAVPDSAPFVALRGQVAGSRNRFVARRDVAADRWHEFVTGANPPDSSGEADPCQDLPTLAR